MSNAWDGLFRKEGRGVHDELLTENDEKELSRAIARRLVSKEDAENLRTDPEAPKKIQEMKEQLDFRDTVAKGLLGQVEYVPRSYGASEKATQPRRKLVPQLFQLFVDEVSEAGSTLATPGGYTLDRAIAYLRGSNSNTAEANRLISQMIQEDEFRLLKVLLGSNRIWGTPDANLDWILSSESMRERYPRTLNMLVAQGYIDNEATRVASEEKVWLRHPDFENPFEIAKSIKDKGAFVDFEENSEAIKENLIEGLKVRRDHASSLLSDHEKREEKLKDLDNMRTALKESGLSESVTYDQVVGMLEASHQSRNVHAESHEKISNELSALREEEGRVGSKFMAG